MHPKSCASYYTPYPTQSDMDWNGYSPYAPSVSGPLADLPRAAARAEFDHLMKRKGERIVELAKLVGANGLRLDVTDESLDQMEEWFGANVEPFPEGPDRLRPLWYAVVADIGLRLGEVMIARAPGLSWEFYEWGGRGKRKHISYQRHVIMGFTRAANPRYDHDPAFEVAAYGVRVVSGSAGDLGFFRQIVDDAVSYA
jgi:hypothetical protein